MFLGKFREEWRKNKYLEPFGGKFPEINAREIVTLAWVLAALGVFIRDIGQITALLTTVLLFISPVFYPISSLPAQYQKILLLNPLTFVIEESRRIMFFGTVPDFQGFLLATGVSLLLSWAGFWWFQRTRKGFADVL